MLLRLVLFPRETTIVCHMEICSSLSQSTCLGLCGGVCPIRGSAGRPTSSHTKLGSPGLPLSAIKVILRPYLHSLFYFAICPEPTWGRRYCVLGTQWGADHGGPGLLCLRVWNYVDQRVSMTMSTGWEGPQKAAVNGCGYQDHWEPAPALPLTTTWLWSNRLHFPGFSFLMCRMSWFIKIFNGPLKLLKKEDFLTGGSLED